MSKFLLLPLLALLSCSENQPEEKDAVGKFREGTAITNLEDNARVEEICRALANKENVLNVLSGNQFTFSYTEKSCSGASLPTAEDINVRMAQSDSSYVFKKTVNGELFGFPNVETESMGAMEEICNFGGTLESPIKTSTRATFWTTFSSAEHCEPGAGSRCIHLQRGVYDESKNKYLIQTEEWIKFNVEVRGHREGFFLKRKLVSTAGCGKDQTTERRAELK